MRSNIQKFKSIEFSFLTHKDKACIFLLFPIDTDLKTALHKIMPLKWSKTHKMWYGLDMPQYRTAFGLPKKSILSLYTSHLAACNNVHLHNLLDMLILKGYSQHTIATYCSEVFQFLKLLKSIDAVTLNTYKLKSYVLYCNKTLKLSENSIHSRMNALKFFYEMVIKNGVLISDIPRPKKKSMLPKGLSRIDILKLLNTCQNNKHKLIIKLIYGMGLRVSELTCLKITHIDSSNMQVFIENAKGKKDRIATLPETILPDLRNYYLEYKPKVYLFEGQTGGQYTNRSVQAVFKKYMQLANINKPIGVHGLRHSYATHLLENGTDIRFIKDLLGHKNLKTTEIYTQVTDITLRKIKSPLDVL